MALLYPSGNFRLLKAYKKTRDFFPGIRWSVSVLYAWRLLPVPGVAGFSKRLPQNSTAVRYASLLIIGAHALHLTVRLFCIVIFLLSFYIIPRFIYADRFEFSTFYSKYFFATDPGVNHHNTQHATHESLDQSFSFIPRSTSNKFRSVRFRTASSFRSWRLPWRCASSLCTFLRLRRFRAWKQECL